MRVAAVLDDGVPHAVSARISAVARTKQVRLMAFPFQNTRTTREPTPLESQSGLHMTMVRCDANCAHLFDMRKSGVM